MVTPLRKVIGLLALAQLAAAPLRAQAAAIDSLFPAQPSGYLTDAAHVVDPTSAAAIEDLATRVRGATKAEIAVVVLPTIGDRAPVDVATEIGRAWKVGAAAAIGDATRNAGVVLLLVPLKDHRRGTGAVFIATGRGVEGFITDSRAGAIRDAMIPELSAEEYGPALLTGTRLLAVAIGKGLGVPDSVIANWRGTEEASGGETTASPGPSSWWRSSSSSPSSGAGGDAGDGGAGPGYIGAEDSAAGSVAVALAVASGGAEGGSAGSAAEADSAAAAPVGASR